MALPGPALLIAMQHTSLIYATGCVIATHQIPPFTSLRHKAGGLTAAAIDSMSLARHERIWVRHFKLAVIGVICPLDNLAMP